MGVPMVIRRVGMCTAVGLNAPAACAAIRVGIKGFHETAFTYDGDWMQGAEVPLKKPWRGREKLLRLAESVVRECAADCMPTVLREVPLVLNLAEGDRPGRMEELDHGFLHELIERLGGTFHPDSRVLQNGRVGGVQMLDVAAEFFRHHCPACLVVGVGQPSQCADAELLPRTRTIADSGKLRRLYPWRGRRRSLAGAHRGYRRSTTDHPRLGLRQGGRTHHFGASAQRPRAGPSDQGRHPEWRHRVRSARLPHLRRQRRAIHLQGVRPCLGANFACTQRLPRYLAYGRLHWGGRRSHSTVCACGSLGGCAQEICSGRRCDRALWQR